MSPATFGQLSFSEVGTATAQVSDCGSYRYRLGRRWARGPGVLFIMLNPSTADATQDDATIRRCIGFAKEWQMGALGVVNLYALRATDPRALALADDPVGPLNNDAIHDAITESRLVVAAWGAHPMAAHRVSALTEATDAIGRTLACLGTTKAGHPRHPVRLPYGTPLVPWPR
jgi:hypothetical protein